MLGVHDAVAEEFGQVSQAIHWGVLNYVYVSCFSCRFCKSSDDSKRLKVSQILERLINLTIEQKEMYPSIQAKIWGSIGQVDLLPFYLIHVSHFHCI